MNAWKSLYCSPNTFATKYEKHTFDLSIVFLVIIFEYLIIKESISVILGYHIFRCFFSIVDKNVNVYVD